MANIGSLDTGVLALLGYAVVFLGIVLLMLVVMLLGRVMSGPRKKTAPVEAAPAPAAPEAPRPTAPGTAGKLMLHDVEPKTAALLMAIVADKMGRPINELRFISIKEVK